MHGPTCIFWANLTPFSLQAYSSLDLGLRRCPGPHLATTREVGRPPSEEVIFVYMAVGLSAAGLLPEVFLFGSL